MIRSLPLTLYRLATGLAEPGAGWLLRRRERRGKEDAARLDERLGHAGRPRPEGPLVWLHGASVGEALAALPLVARLIERGFAVLLTTGTVSSSRILPARLPTGALHQFVPLDLPAAVSRFFDHWRPSLVGFIESELWPNLLAEAARRRIPAVLVNARMSARSFARWGRMPQIIGPLLGSFGMILAQSDADAERLRTLGGTAVTCTGNLKFDADPPPADEDESQHLRRAVGRRPVWIAASTHDGEDLECVGVHRQLAERWPDLLTVIVPRRTERGDAIAIEARSLGLTASQRSCGEALDETTAVHVADTMGEIGLFYRLAPIVFVGKSLDEGGGGQNPIEPVKLGCAVLHGPHVANFRDTYAVLDASGGSVPVPDGAGLAAAVARLLANPEGCREIAHAAADAVAQLGGATSRTMAALEPLCARALAIPS